MEIVRPKGPSARLKRAAIKSHRSIQGILSRSNISDVLTLADSILPFAA